MIPRKLFNNKIIKNARCILFLGNLQAMAQKCAFETEQLHLNMQGVVPHYNMHTPTHMHSKKNFMRLHMKISLLTFSKDFIS